jgi:hypothetical protein
VDGGDSMKKHIFTWEHKKSSGEVIGEIRRCIDEEIGRKEDIPCYICNVNGGFDKGTTDEMKSNGNPLFGLETIVDKTKLIIVPEGQKAAAAWQSLGYQCVTSILGATNAHKSNWSALEGVKEIYLAPDNDEAGEKYIKDVAEILSCFNNPPIVQVIKLPNLKESGDICDWLKQQPELKDWNELDSLKDHPAKEIIRARLDQVIEDNLHPAPSDWIDWPEPDEIENNTLLPVKALSLEILPEPYKEFIRDIAYRMQCPVDFVAISSVITTATVVGAGCGIKPKQFDDWLVIPNLWGAAIGRPAILKTPSVNEPLKMLSKLEKTSQEALNKEKDSYDADMVVYGLRIKNAHNDIGSAFNNNSESEIDASKKRYALVQQDKPTKPVVRRFKSNDSTIEKMGEVLAENPRGILLYRDELTGLLHSWDKDGHEADRAFYLEAWTGGNSFTTDRIGRGTIEVENMCVSLIGTIQPDKLIKYLYQALNGHNDGFMQRLQLAVYPDEPNWKLIDMVPNSQEKERAFEIVKALASMDFTSHGAILQVGEKIPCFRFCSGAQPLFNGWLISLEQKIRNEESPVIQEHLAKYRSLMPSLALLFHLINLASGDCYEEVGVSRGATEKAVAWCEYLESHARRIYGLCSTFEQQAVIALSKKIKNGGLQNPFAIRDIYRKQWHRLTDKNLVQVACDELVEAGWLRKNVVPPAFMQKSKISYLINPKLRGESNDPKS